MKNGGDFDCRFTLGIEEDAIIAAPDAKASPRWLKLLHVALAAGEISIDAMEDLQRCSAVDRPKIGASFWGPGNSNPLGSGVFTHSLRPNSRSIASWGTPSPRAREARARSSAAAAAG